MAFTLMEFDKNWNNSTDFPTHENREAQVRADIQYLFDSIKDQFNNFVENELKADNLPYEYEGENITVGEIFSMIEDQIRSLAIGEAVIPSGSITEEKIHTDAINTDAIIDLAVTTDKLDDGAVTTDKLDDKAVTHDKLGLGAVKTDNIEDYQVTALKLARDAVTELKIKNGAVTRDKILDGEVVYGKLAKDSVVALNIKDGEVGTAELDDLAVTTAKIEDGAVTLAKTTGIQKQHTIVGPITIPFGDWLKYVKGEPEDEDYEEITYTAHEAYLATIIQEETGEEMTWDEYEEWFDTQHDAWEEDYAEWEDSGEGDPPEEPVKIIDEYTKEEIHSLNITVTGVSLEHVDTQMVNYLPATDAMLLAMGDNCVRCVRVPPAENTVTVKCENVPEIDISLYFDIYD